MLALRPPRVAPQQVVIVPIFRGDDHAGVRQAAAAVDDELRLRRSRPRRRSARVGFKFHESELKGVPVRVEISERDLAAPAVTVARRDSAEKQQVPLARMSAAVGARTRRRAGVAPAHGP